MRNNEQLSLFDQLEPDFRSMQNERTRSAWLADAASASKSVLAEVTGHHGCGLVTDA